VVISRDVMRTRLNLTYIPSLITYLHVFAQCNCNREDSYHIQLIHLVQWYRHRYYVVGDPMRPNLGRPQLLLYSHIVNHVCYVTINSFSSDP